MGTTARKNRRKAAAAEPDPDFALVVGPRQVAARYRIRFQKAQAFMAAGVIRAENLNATSDKPRWRTCEAWLREYEGRGRRAAAAR